MKKILTFILFISLFGLFGCSKNKGFTKTIYVFDTTVTITIYDGIEENVDDIIEILNDVHNLTDAYNTYYGITNVKSINDGIKAGQTRFKVDGDLATMLSFTNNWPVAIHKGIDYKNYIMFGVGELTNLWKDAISKKQLPAPDKINQIVQDIKDEKYNYGLSRPDLWVEEGSKVQFDLGSVAKGYAAHKVYDYLYTQGINNYLIDLGQSTILLGEKADGSGFNVAVNGTDFVFKGLKNCCVCTASILEQNMEIEGKVYHHIIDLSTGYPTNTYDTVVVIQDSYYFYADLNCTYLMIHPDDAEALWQAFEYGHCTSFFFKDGELSTSVGNGYITRTK